MEPPKPIPPFLAPQAGDLGPGDLVLVATSDELAAIAAALKALGMDPSVARIVHRDGSPWIEIGAMALDRQALDRQARAWSDTLGAAAVGEFVKLALWRYTLAVYRVIDGAVEDDPIWRP